ncbi:hypothetical protein AB0K60_03215 [Thermopolyspora sp. NPDC052614]|uniref:hypothetical protein n=1 Tax=Thermopolyspora sp. NPDC052614 TaxID=3155682 RepID=UPI0034454A52
MAVLDRRDLPRRVVRVLNPVFMSLHADGAVDVRGVPPARKTLPSRSGAFVQEAQAIGRLFTIAAQFTDPDVYFLGGGVVEAAPHFREWFLERVREHVILREEQRRASELLLVHDLDMAGARGAALAALQTVTGA